MAKNNNRLKQVRNVKGPKEPETPTKREIEINPGNTAVLTVRLLNSIHSILSEIRDELRAKNG